MLTTQLRISNVSPGGHGRLVPRILSIKASKLRDYVEREINQCNRVYTPDRSKEFDYMPLLSLWDLADTGEEFIYSAWADFPKETVFNKNGIPVLIILPEDSEDDLGVNKLSHLKLKQREKFAEHVKRAPHIPFVLNHGGKE